MSDTIARLASLRAQQAAHIPDFGSSNHLSTLADFGSNPGALQSRFYLPENLPKGAPLVIVLHGCTQNAAGYDHHSGWSQLADEAGFALLYPVPTIRTSVSTGSCLMTRAAIPARHFRSVR